MADYSVDVNNSGGLVVDSDVQLSGLDDIRTQSALTGEATVRSDSKVTSESVGRLSVEPVEVSSSASLGVDLQPVAVDTCLRIELAPPPPTVVRTPWTSRLGFSVLGVELVALSVDGELCTHVEPAPRRPQVLGAVEQHAQVPAAPKRPTGVTVRIGP